jgi:adenosylcobyric acid synthase
MLGQLIFDPNGIETEGSTKGLGLLPINTNMQPAKVTLAAVGHFTAPSLFCRPVGKIAVRGYEIHVGATSYLSGAQPFAQLVRQTAGHAESVIDGCISPDTRIFGTYLHGLFDEDSFRHAFIDAAREFYHLNPVSERNNWRSSREESFNRLANAVSQSLDMQSIFEWAGVRYQSRQLLETEEAAR